MNSSFQNGFQEATRLTREGRFNEATALIQQLLNGNVPDVSPSDPPSSTRPDRQRESLILEGVAEVIDADDEAANQDDYDADCGCHSPGQQTSSAPLADWAERLRQQLGQHMPGGLNQTRSEPVPDGAEFLYRSYQGRTYKLYVPSSYRQDQPLPLIVMLHGCTQDPDDFAAGTKMNHLAEQHGLLIAYPLQTTSANPTKCWNWFNRTDQQREQGEPALIAGITRDIIDSYSVDRSKVYVAGLSAGGAMAAIMAASYPDLYAAVGVHSGLAAGAASDLPSALAAMRQGGNVGSHQRSAIPVIVFHGDRDTTVSLRNGEQVIESMVASGATNTTEHAKAAGGRGYTRICHRNNQDQVIAEFWQVDGAGHAWMGGSPTGSYTDPTGPDASAEMIRFFLEHPRS